MDYTLFTEEQLIKRFNTLPDSIKEVLVSDNAKDILNAISHGHYLTDEEKNLMLEQLTALVLFGFLAPEELAFEIENNLHVNYKGSKAISEEINRRIFKKVENELKDVYKPIELDSSKDEDVIDLSEKTENFVKSNFEIPIKDGFSVDDNNKDAPAVLNISNEVEKQEMEIGGLNNNLQPTTHNSQQKENLEEIEAPTILHKETNIKPISALKTSLGGLFGFSKFNQQQKTNNQQQKPIMAEVNIEYDVKKLEKEPEISKTEAPKMRIVNYGIAPKKDENIFEFNPQPTTHNLQRKVENMSVLKPSFAYSSYEIPGEQGNTTEGVEEKEIKPIFLANSQEQIANNSQQLEKEIKEDVKTSAMPSYEEINLKDRVGNGDIVEIPTVLREETTFQKGDMQIRNNEINKVVGIEISKKIEEPIKAKHIDYTAEKEIKLEDIPVGEDVVDLRKIEEERSPNN